MEFTPSRSVSPEGFAALRDLIPLFDFPFYLQLLVQGCVADVFLPLQGILLSWGVFPPSMS